MRGDRESVRRVSGRWGFGGVAVLALSLAMLAAWATPSAAQDYLFGQNKVQYKSFNWRYVSSDHFEVYYYDDLDSLALRVLDLAEKANVYLSVKMGHQLGNKVPII